MTEHMKMFFQNIKTSVKQWSSKSRVAISAIHIRKRTHEQKVLDKYSTPGLRKNKLEK
jgi:hypothetical protein